MINSFKLGPNKQLNEIVVAGSHDAGITAGGGNVRTQARDIAGQAKAGVRVFDLRIAAATVASTPGGQKVAELKAFHADGKLMKNEAKPRSFAGTHAPVDMTRTKLRGGAFGAGLAEMLDGAKRFVESAEGGNEFLILKFDKCLNWPLIAEACITVLGKSIYKGGGNLNTTQLKDLKGKVIVVFSGEGVKALHSMAGPSDGILSFKNLYDKSGGAAYSKSFAGLQYYGKGGTSVMKPFGKLDQNEKKQRKLMDGAKLIGPDVMGMMYWTTTGMFESIKKRNDKMWDSPNVVRLKKLWAQGLEEFVETRNPLYVPSGSAATVSARKRYMPNIIMIDFADDAKCQQIHDLNTLSDSDLAALNSD